MNWLKDRKKDNKMKAEYLFTKTGIVNASIKSNLSEKKKKEFQDFLMMIIGDVPTFEKVRAKALKKDVIWTELDEFKVFIGGSKNYHIIMPFTVGITPSIENRSNLKENIIYIDVSMPPIALSEKETKWFGLDIVTDVHMKRQSPNLNKRRFDLNRAFNKITPYTRLYEMFEVVWDVVFKDLTEETPVYSLLKRHAEQAYLLIENKTD